MRRTHLIDEYAVFWGLIQGWLILADDLLRRILRGIVSAAVLAWTVAGVLVGLTRLVASLLWEAIDHRDRAVLVRAARSAPGLAWRGAVATAVLAWAVVLWMQRPLERALERFLDSLHREIRRAEHRRERVLRDMRQEWRPEPEEDCDELYEEYGNPVGTGRRHAA